MSTVLSLPSDLVRKYNVPGPRYTSYPTVPYWDQQGFDASTWRELVRETFLATNRDEGISLYLHLPFCESLCTYCGCNKHITVNHAVEMPYIDSLLTEWRMYLNLFREAPRLAELHLGGGTPTFFQPENLAKLIRGLKQTSVLRPDAELSLEGHPGNTSREHLQVLYDLGFRRLSLGIQDFDPLVQRLINRIQPFEQVAAVTEAAREIGYTSVNFDLIYGLPRQTKEGLRDTLRQAISLQPDRVAFYSYAHVPWTAKGQRAYSEADLPRDAEKLALYLLGREAFEEAGYCSVAMDHFALPDDPLFTALETGQLYRNFMGYTPRSTTMQLGLGASAISDSWTGFAQNVKTVAGYQQQIEQGQLPIFKGHALSLEDLVLRRHILRLMCQGETTWELPAQSCAAWYEGLERLEEMEADGLVEINPFHLRVTEAGRPFLRNVCMAFDARLWRSKPTASLFSATV